MSRSRGIGIGIPFFSLKGIPYSSNLLRFLRPQVGSIIYDTIGDYDAEEKSLDLYDMNPYDDVDSNFVLQCMNKSDLTIWGATDKDGNTIRDLPGYNVLDPYEWLDEELNVDIFNTYISDAYVARLFTNFFDDKTDLAVYDRQMTCDESKIIHQKLYTGGWWIFNRGILNGCGVIKATGIIWGN
jgi:hypothetical protein